METLIGLLFILLPVILKLIGKKFEAASTEAPDIPYFTDVIDEVMKEVGEHPQPTCEPQPQSQPQPSPQPTYHYRPGTPVSQPKPKAAQPKPKAPILLEEVDTPREPIDLKKMIIYSEIMKPKYDS